eukprot:TRINITY_DN123205_c0_g1_i1.p1 TRINITY_DN123205_c0_g1~~TRINITY_DN123205_c0_g1_i1.p1  ORF type:complete len:405 (+),score=117.50 TRINITY_DN123205_c0_g1_i1:150-1364(+)
MFRSALCRYGGQKGANHPNTSNWNRNFRMDIVARTRKQCEVGLVKERPQWLEWCERVPPMELKGLQLQARTIRNPYPNMLAHLLKKYPDLRFQDCYVDGNDWSVGNDAFRDDHPAMQFVARQLQLMREEGMSKQKAFKETERMFQERREHLEREQKVLMASALDLGLAPMFTTGTAYLEVEKAKNEAAHLNQIRLKLREMRKKQVEEKASDELSREADRSARAGGQEREEEDEEEERIVRDDEKMRTRDILTQRDRKALLREAAPQVPASMRPRAEDAERREEPSSVPDDALQAESGADSVDDVEKISSPAAVEEELTRPPARAAQDSFKSPSSAFEPSIGDRDEELLMKQPQYSPRITKKSADIGALGGFGKKQQLERKRDVAHGDEDSDEEEDAADRGAKKK